MINVDNEIINKTLLYKLYFLAEALVYVLEEVQNVFRKEETISYPTC